MKYTTTEPLHSPISDLSYTFRNLWIHTFTFVCCLIYYCFCGNDFAISENIQTKIYRLFSQTKSVATIHHYYCVTKNFKNSLCYVISVLHSLSRLVCVGRAESAQICSFGRFPSCDIRIALWLKLSKSKDKVFLEEGLGKCVQNKVDATKNAGCFFR